MIGESLDEGRAAPRPRRVPLVGSLTWAQLPTYMPYVYALVLGGVIYATKPDLINGPGALVRRRRHRRRAFRAPSSR